jgi:hypothetical protein
MRIFSVFGRRGVRVAEGVRLESVCRVYPTAGSNPALSVVLLTLKLAGFEPQRVWEKDFPTPSG